MNSILFVLHWRETKLSRYWQRWNWVRIYGGLDIFIWIYFYIFLDWTHYQEEGWGAAWLDRRRGKYKGIEKGWWHGKEMTKKWNDYFYKLMKMLCERRIPRPSVSESSVWANQWLHTAHFWFYRQLSQHYRGFPLSVKVFTIHRKNVKNYIITWEYFKEKGSKCIKSRKPFAHSLLTFCPSYDVCCA